MCHAAMNGFLEVAVGLAADTRAVERIPHDLVAAHAGL